MSISIERLETAIELKGGYGEIIKHPWNDGGRPYRIEPKRTNKFGLLWDLIKKEPVKVPIDEFWTINRLGCSPYPDTWMNILINCTHYFMDFNKEDSLGIPGMASPHPIPKEHEHRFRKMYAYVLPGQNIEFPITMIPEAEDREYSFLAEVSIYSGPEADIANKLLMRGISVTPENVKNFKEE